MFQTIIILVALIISGCKNAQDENVPRPKESIQKSCKDGNLKDCYELGLTENKSGNQTEAIKLYQVACEGGGQGIKGCVELGAMEENKGNTSKARKLYVKACESGGLEGVDGCNYLAKMEDDSGNTASAIKYYKKACETGGEGIYSCVNLGGKEEDKGNMNEAKKYYARSCDNKDGLGCYMIGRIELRKGNKEEAKSYYRKACDNNYDDACEESQRPYKACMCDFGACLSGRNKNCTQVTRCMKTTSEIYADQVHNRKALLVLDSRSFCADPLQGIMKGN